MATGEYVTHQELAVVLEGLATKEDLERFATKEDLQQLEDRLDVKFASKDDLRPIRDDVHLIDGHVQRIEGDVQRIEGDVQRIEGDVQRIEGDLKRIEDKLDARFAGLYALIRDYLLNDAQRDDWDHKNGS